MLDGQADKKMYRARKIIDVGDDKAAGITLNFKAFDDADAQHFLDTNGYTDYVLLKDELKEIVGDSGNKGTYLAE